MDTHEVFGVKYGAFAYSKKTPISFVMFVRTYLRMYELISYLTYFLDF